MPDDDEMKRLQEAEREAAERARRERENDPAPDAHPPAPGGPGDVETYGHTRHED